MTAEYEAIFQRKAVRKYKPERIGESDTERLLRQTGELTPFDSGAPVSFRVLEAGQIKGIGAAKAPHYLAVYSEKDNYINAAFMLQQMDLWLSANGFGACWLGMARPSKASAKADELPFANLLAFGYPVGPPHRQPSEFNRKPLSEITDISGMDKTLEAVRLSPSGMNRQPWYITQGEKTLRLHCRLNAGIPKILFGPLSPLEMGIALCHLWLAVKEAGTFAGFVKENSVTPPTGCEYVYSVLFK